jgi:hypothetical protein
MAKVAEGAKPPGMERTVVGGDVFASYCGRSEGSSRDRCVIDWCVIGASPEGAIRRIEQ